MQFNIDGWLMSPTISGAGRGHRCFGSVYNKPSVVTKVGLNHSVSKRGPVSINNLDLDPPSDGAFQHQG